MPKLRRFGMLVLNRGELASPGTSSPVVLEGPEGEGVGGPVGV
jgi:hypothetical protein